MNVDDVIAHAIYDPVARRQRYLRTRQLKGRQPGSTPPPAPKTASTTSTSSGTVTTAQLSSEAAARASAERQVAAIRVRLDSLKAHLADLLAKKKALATSSSTTKKSSTSSSSTKSGGSSQPKTAKQKAAAKVSLKKAQATRAQQQKATPNQKKPATSLTLDEQITRTRSVIADVETKLRAAIEQTRTQTASNGR